MARLRRSDCSGPGIRRIRKGKGFTYVGHDGKRPSEETFERIRALAIPPAWNDVWICVDPMGHLQATGIDAAGRKQYRYHDRWRERRDTQKFDQMLEFARALPKLRARVLRDLKRKERFSREQVLACAVRLLDHGAFRIGSQEYAENESYGLTTVKKDHVTTNGEVLTFDYSGKAGVKLKQDIADPAIHQIIRDLSEREDGGDELLAYRRNGGWADVGSADVNDYLKAITGGSFSAKDFRTWNATMVAALELAKAAAAQPVRSATAHKRVISSVVKQVAEYLGNTPTVARNAYIDPRVFDRFRSGWTVTGVLTAKGDVPDLRRPATRRRVEQAVIDLIEDPAETPVVEKIAA